jgi:hypothetical protein
MMMTMQCEYKYVCVCVCVCVYIGYHWDPGDLIYTYLHIYPARVCADTRLQTSLSILYHALQHASGMSERKLMYNWIHILFESIFFEFCLHFFYTTLRTII